METMLKVERLSKKPILDDISFDLNKGDVLALIGPNGSGKSTLMKSIMGFDVIDKGNVYINGFSFNDRKNALKYVACSIEYPTLYPDLNGEQHFRLFSKLKNVPKEEVKYYKEFCRLESKLKQKIKYYSVGMKQILMLSLTMMEQPSLIILDEPFNGLDIQTKNRVMNQLKELNKQGTTILWSSHELNQLMEISSSFLFMHKGRIVGEKSKCNITLSDLENYYLKVCSE